MPTAGSTSLRTAPLPPLTRGRKRFFDYELAASMLVGLYVVLKFQPFVVLVQVPGLVSSVGFPVLCLGVLLLTPSDRLARIPVSLTLWMLIAWLAASYQWSEIPLSTFYLIRSDLVPLFCLTLVAGIVRPGILIGRLVVLFSGIVVWSLIASNLLPVSRSLLETNGQPGFRGTFGHKNELGIFAVFTLCLVLAFVHGRLRRPLVIVCVVTVLGTRSATAASGLMAVSFIWFWVAAISSQRSPVDRAFLRIVSTVSLILAVLLSVGFVSVFLDIYGKDVTFSGRTIIWNESITTILQRPLNGYGFGGVWSDGRSGVTADLWRRIGFGAAHAHNGALELLLQVGIVGLGLMLVFLGQTVNAATLCGKNPAWKDRGRWAILTVCALVLMSLSEPLFSGASLSALVLISVVLAATLRGADADAAPKASRRHHVSPNFGVDPVTPVSVIGSSRDR